MKEEAQRTAIAEACGWREAFPKGEEPHSETRKGGILLPYNLVNEITHERAFTPPDYLNDLNAMHEAESNLSHEQLLGFDRRLHIDICKGDFQKAIHATAAQRAEAFLKALNLWQD